MTRMILDNVRLAYTHLDQPRAAAEGAEPKYSCVMIIPKNHPQLQALKDILKEAITQKFGAKRPTGLRNPLRDGDEVDAETGARVKGDEFTGAFYISASSKKPVDVIVGKAKAKASDPEHFRSGHYASVRVAAFGYEAAGNRGAALGLNGVWITKRGEPLGQAPEPYAEVEAEDFGAVVAKAASAPKEDDDIF